MTPSRQATDAARVDERLTGPLFKVVLGFALLLSAAIAKEQYLLAALPLVVGIVALSLARKDLLLLGLVATVPSVSYTHLTLPTICSV